MAKIKNNMENEDFRDKLRVEGILFKGFGHIPQFIMCDTDITLDAKGIYAYFCSFAGSGNSAFPSRGKILRDLNIGKDKYYNHYKQLINNGYIFAEQERVKDIKTGEVFLGNNIYTLIANPKKYIEEIAQENLHEDKIYSRIRNSGMKSSGYGTIAKAVMLDVRLPLKSKGIYAYFCSFAGSGNSAFPKLNDILYHLQVSEDTYYKYYKILVNFNYITPVQRNIRGKFSVNDFYINETPDIELIENNPFPKNTDTEESVDSTTSSPFPKNTDTENTDTENTNTENTDTENTNTENTNTNNTNNINTNNIYYNHSVNLNGKSEFENIKSLFKDKLKIKDLKISHATEKKLIDEIELNVLEMFFNEYTIINGQKKSQEIVRNALLKLTDWHIDNLIFKYIEKSSTTQIKNPKAYVQAMIYNIALENELSIKNELKFIGAI